MYKERIKTTREGRRQNIKDIQSKRQIQDSLEQISKLSHGDLWPSGLDKNFLSLHSRFKSQPYLSFPWCLICLLGLQGIQWVRELVVVCVSWPEHPGLYIYKKKNLANFLILLTSLILCKWSFSQLFVMN